MHLKTIERASSQLIPGFAGADPEARMGNPERRAAEASRSMFDRLVELGGKFLQPRNRTPISALTATELLFPARPGVFNIWERRAVAAFAAILTDNRRKDQYVAMLTEDGDDDGMLADLLMSGQDLSRIVLAEATRLAHEPMTQDSYRVSEQLRLRLGDRLAAALDHVWLIAARQTERGARDEAAHRRLTRAGWSAAEIAILEQIVRLLIPARRTHH